MVKQITIVDEMMERFGYAYQKAQPYFEKFQVIQNSYDNEVDSIQWPTQSEIPFPLTFISVEEQLPHAMTHLFPRRRGVQLIPYKEMKLDIIRRLERDLKYTADVEMNLQHELLPTIKDCWKFAVGYTLIDMEMITPPDVVTNVLSVGGETIEEIPEMVLGEPVLTPVAKYLGVNQVIPMPGGANIDGPNQAPGHFVVMFYYEDEFRDMFRDHDTLEGRRPLLTGDVDKMVDEARSLKFDARMQPIDIIHRLAGLDLQDVNQQDRRIPVWIPVVRCYFPHRQVWIANGTTKIFDMQDKWQTLRSDVCKFSAWPDGKRWYAPGVTELSQRLNWGVNIWYNGLVDLAMYAMNPTRVLNSSTMDTTEQPRGPRADVIVNGDVRQAASYMELPDFPNNLFGMGEILQNLHGQTNAQSNALRQGQAGLVRGGTNALETMLSSTTGRQLLASMILQTGGLKPVYERILIKKQMLVGDEGHQFIDPVQDPDTGDRLFQQVRVTRRELRNVFRVDLDLPAARLNSAAAFAERSAYFDRAQQDGPLHRKRAMYEELADDDRFSERVLQPENVFAEREARQAEAALRTAEAGGEQAAAATAPEGQQALAGAAALGGPGV